MQNKNIIINIWPAIKVAVKAYEFASNEFMGYNNDDKYGMRQS